LSYTVHKIHTAYFYYSSMLYLIVGFKGEVYYLRVVCYTMCEASG